MCCTDVEPKPNATLPMRKRGKESESTPKLNFVIQNYQTLVSSIFIYMNMSELSKSLYLYMYPMHI